ncbi:MAG: polysaccharide biosynthesis protein [Paludibacteraceae bacterium]|nr:polysaccharide biosynthesis protein [Paludibacteraceae bacterium]MBQ2189941.1 polysaccharide biosynthesis protein [Paludibacteraceae bacterium]MBQ4018070.1 polysaccharide biosynthesis protein [Paludibacteraceae bacterium]MBQ5378825.1 polysaccharide biosynthesis protein [Paludibacteraceae bacterium]
MSYMPRWGVLLTDLLLCSIAFWTSLWIGSGFFHYVDLNQQPVSIGAQFLIVMGVQLITFWAFHTYSGILRYSTFIDASKVLLSNVTVGLALVAVNLIMDETAGYHPMMNTVLAMYVPTAFVLLFALRVGVKTLSETMEQNQGNPRVMIYGTQTAGLAIAKMLRSAGNTPYRPMGFIANKTERHDYDLAGLRVRTLNEDLFQWMDAHNIHHVIVSPIKMREINPAKDLQIFIDHNIRVLTTPYFTQFDNTEDIDAQRIGRIDSVRIEDLLERPKIDIDTDNVRQILHGQVVLVSGAAGSIGSELVRQIQCYQPQATILVDIAESPLHDLILELQNQFPESRLIPVIADVRNRSRIEQIFNEMRPDVVYHAAAYKHVPLMESYPNEAIQANVLGTKNMADMAVQYKVKRFVMISTDKAVNPTNIMGASKRIAEIYVQSLFRKLNAQDDECTKFITTRFGNVLGSNGSVIPYFRKQIAAGGPVTVTHPDIIRYFMTIPEACCLVMEASTLGKGGEIFVFDMGKPVKILDLARNMIRLAGYIPEKDIPIVFTGLRPGEKLYEELLNQKETTMPTTNEKIMVARVREFDFDQISGKVDQLIATSRQGKPFTTVKMMKQLVPEYISNNSIYEQLDPQ